MMIRGKARWAKILGKPVDGYKSKAEKNKEWTFDIELDADGRDALIAQGFGDRLKHKDGITTFKFKRKAYKADGTASKPIKVVDSQGNTWPDDKLIGNESVLNVKYNVRQWADGEGQSADVLAVQVWEYVPYEGGEQFPTREDSSDDNGDKEQW